MRARCDRERRHGRQLTECAALLESLREPREMDPDGGLRLDRNSLGILGESLVSRSIGHYGQIPRSLGVNPKESGLYSGVMAPQVRLEPTTPRLTAEAAVAEQGATVAPEKASLKKTASRTRAPARARKAPKVANLRHAGHPSTSQQVGRWSSDKFSRDRRVHFRLP